jgi:hypothetical protein
MDPSARSGQLAEALKEAEAEFVEAQKALFLHQPGAPQRFERACERVRALHLERDRDDRFHRLLEKADGELLTAARALYSGEPGSQQRYDAALLRYEQLCNIDPSTHTPGGTPRVQP